jgi:hypothetical protein
MPVDWVRGFRRIGWVVTIVMAPFIIRTTYQEAKEFAGYNREVMIASEYFKTNFSSMTSPEPQDSDRIVDQMIKYLELERQGKKPTLQNGTSIDTLRLLGDFPNRHEVEVLRVNKIKFLGWTVGLIVGVAVIIQGTMSLLAWVFRGFKG